jgi:hypothetical protein
VSTSNAPSILVNRPTKPPGENGVTCRL